MNIIFNKIEEYYQRQLPFVSYRKPNAKDVSGFFVNDDVLNYTSDFSERGFVFAPFNDDEKAVLFKSDTADFFTKKLNLYTKPNLNLKFDESKHQKETHIRLVEKALDEINKNELKKVVVSRKETIELKNFDVLKTFIKLLKTYKNAFVYVWFHPKVGLWFGATPETLLLTSNNQFKTMSLAGTQVYVKNEKFLWKSKELEEQQMVTDFIENQLNPIAKDLKINKTETVKAGNLLHLSTKVEGNLNKNSSLKELIRALHPTPAVCGLPREKAKNFIQINENYQRTFYTGFLGELNLENNESSLFVNLRCMSIQNKIASIYVGGGITKDSNAKKEWEETVFKSKTIKKVL